MRKLELLQKPDPIALARAKRSGAPFAHAIDCKDRSGIERARKECAGSVAFVMVCEYDSRLRRLFEMLSQSAAGIKLLLEPDRHRDSKAPEPARCVREVSLEQAIKFRQRFIIKGDVIQPFGSNTARVQAVGNGLSGKTWIML